MSNTLMFYTIAQLVIFIIIIVTLIMWCFYYKNFETFCFVERNISLNGNYITELLDLNTGDRYTIINDKDLYQNVANWKKIKIIVKQKMDGARYYKEFVGAVE